MSVKRLRYSEIGLAWVGKKLRGQSRGIISSCSEKTITLKVIDVTFGGDVVIHRRSYGQQTVTQEDFLEFAKSAKQLDS